ncbi:hypothetical protein KIF24_24800 [Micromonospora sp. Llam7]|uniref:hypothetical protein n=1 Tax=Micromonospora tarapacensis TaxID=2835305 RepID=UPI001C833551|nr:hypothetical protein [Micromonospora tarapacensis]MBX7268932.1 hypothetical protein [Micromonospora tarapacensis]
MLTRTLRRALLIAAAVIAVLGSAAAPAQAEDVWVCPPVGDCYLVIEKPGDGGGDTPPGGGEGGGTQECTSNGVVVPCWQAGWGYLNPADGCYYIVESPQPAAGDPAWEGHEPGDGAVYRQRCYGDVIGALVWREDPPPGTPGSLSPAQLAARAIKELPMRGAQIGISPNPSGTGLVGLPVWMWTAVTPQTWGPITATASVPGLSVTARGQATKIRWEMGDGRSVTCGNPGTRYDKAKHGASESPTCGYDDGYSLPSRTKSGGRYTITATTTWHIDWWVVGGGATGTETVTRESTTSVRIDELQVVTG